MRFLGSDIGAFSSRSVEEKSNKVVILWKKNEWKIMF